LVPGNIMASPFLPIKRMALFKTRPASPDDSLWPLFPLSSLSEAVFRRLSYLGRIFCVGIGKPTLSPLVKPRMLSDLGAQNNLVPSLSFSTLAVRRPSSRGFSHRKLTLPSSLSLPPITGNLLPEIVKCRSPHLPESPPRDSAVSTIGSSAFDQACKPEVETSPTSPVLPINSFFSYPPQSPEISSGLSLPLAI